MRATKKNLFELAGFARELFEKDQRDIVKTVANSFSRDEVEAIVAEIGYVKECFVEALKENRMLH